MLYKNIVSYVSLSHSELKDIRERDLTTDKNRQEVGSDLMETVSVGGQKGIEAAKILVENNMSYYGYKHRTKILSGAEDSDNFSYRYACAQLVQFVYQNHGVFEELPNILNNLLEIKDEYTKKRKSYRTNLHRFYDRSIDDGVEKTGSEEFEENVNIVREDVDEDIDNSKQGKRIELADSNRRGIVKANENIIEFEIYDRTSKNVLDKSIKGIKYLKKCIFLMYEIVGNVSKDNASAIQKQLSSVVSRIQEIADTMLNDVGRRALERLVEISGAMDKDQKDGLLDILLDSVVDGFNLNPDELLLDYVIKQDGDIDRKQSAKDVIKNNYGISEEGGFILTYETDKEIRKAYVALCVIDNREDFSFTMVNVGFTQFYYR